MGSTGSRGRAWSCVVLGSQASGHPAREHVRREPFSGGTLDGTASCPGDGSGDRVVKSCIASTCDWPSGRIGSAPASFGRLTQG